MNKVMESPPILAIECANCHTMNYYKAPEITLPELGCTTEGEVLCRNCMMPGQKFEGETLHWKLTLSDFYLEEFPE